MRHARLGRSLAALALLSGLGCAGRRCPCWIEAGSLAKYEGMHPEGRAVVLHRTTGAVPIEASELQADVQRSGRDAVEWKARRLSARWTTQLDLLLTTPEDREMTKEEWARFQQQLAAVDREVRELLPFARDGHPKRPNLVPAMQVLARAVAADECQSILALSGGGQNGAFGAGFLKQWYVQEPTFDPRIVTGVSTGALQCSFVFVNQPWAWQRLQQAYTSSGTNDLIEDRPMATVPFSTSLCTARGLARLIDRYVDDALIDAVAADGVARGRHLYVATVNLDTGVLNIWDMVELARTRQYDRYRLVLRASAHCPPIFPPVCIDGMLHQDGGVRQQVFVVNLLHVHEREHESRGALVAQEAAKVRELLTPGEGDESALADHLVELRSHVGKLHPRASFVVNGSLSSLTHCTQCDFFDICMRSVGLLEEEAMIGTIWKSWSELRLYAQQSVCPEPLFRLTSIPEWARVKKGSSLRFTREDCRKLFADGCKVATLPNAWMTSPYHLPSVVAYQPQSGEPEPAPPIPPPPGQCPFPVPP